MALTTDGMVTSWPSGRTFGKATTKALLGNLEVLDLGGNNAIKAERETVCRAY